MTRSRIRQIVVVLLLLTFVAIWIATQRNERPESGSAPPPRREAQPTPPERPEELQKGVPEESPSPAGLEAGRDPFQVPHSLEEAVRQQQDKAAAQIQAQGLGGPSAENPVPPLELQGILWGTRRPQAIINRRVVSAGDTLENAQILEVTQEGVKVSLNGREFQLKLPEKVKRQGDARTESQPFPINR